MNEFNEDAFIIGTMTYSFSRLNSFYTCPYEWYEDYVKCTPKDGSAQAQFGTLLHEILEKYVSGTLSIFELSTFYMDNFDKYVTYDFPPNKYVDLRQKYYDAGLEYLDNIDLDLEGYDVIGVEKKVEFKIGEYDCIGFIDLLLRDKQTGEIIILDHKSASIGILKSGNIAKKDREHFDSFKKQLYLYSKAVINEYGRVDKLKWNLFKERKYIEIPFDQKEYDESIEWAANTIKAIENEKEWGINPEFIKAQNNGKYPPFYCMHLCSQRFKCSYKNEYLDALRYQKYVDGVDYDGSDIRMQSDSNLYIYLTINLINDMGYIGRRECCCPIEEDEYLGSGTILKLAIEKYGKENFKKQILCICNSRDELYAKEKEYIAKFDAVNSYDFYNIDYGGEPKGTVNLSKEQFIKEKYMTKKIQSNTVDVKYFLKVMSDCDDMELDQSDQLYQLDQFINNKNDKSDSPLVSIAKLTITDDVSFVDYITGFDNIKGKREDVVSSTACQHEQKRLIYRNPEGYLKRKNYKEVPSDIYDNFYNMFGDYNANVLKSIEYAKNYFDRIDKEEVNVVNNVVNNVANDVKINNSKVVEKTVEDKAPRHKKESQKIGNVTDFLKDKKSNASYKNLSNLLDKYSDSGLGKQVIYYAVTGHGSIQKGHLSTVECSKATYNKASNALDYALKFKDIGDKLSGKRDYFYMSIIFCFNNKSVDSDELCRKMHKKYSRVSPPKSINNFDDAINYVGAYYNYNRSQKDKVDIVGDFSRSRKQQLIMVV